MLLQLLSLFLNYLCCKQREPGKKAFLTVKYWCAYISARRDAYAKSLIENHKAMD